MNRQQKETPEETAARREKARREGKLVTGKIHVKHNPGKGLKLMFQKVCDNGG